MREREPEFEPCRHERCRINGLHQKHLDDDGTELCPECYSPLIITKRRSAKCIKCSWHGQIPSKRPRKTNA